MEHKGTICLETGRLLLRPFTTEDAEAMFRNWAKDDEVTKFLTWPTHKDQSITEAVLSSWVQQYAKLDYYQWAIVLKEMSPEPIGSISVVNEIDARIQAAEIGYCIGKKWWHRGVTSEALSRVMDYLFDEVGVNKIVARHDVNNPNSGLVMRKCGMQYEGTLRQEAWNNQGVCDVAHYGLLKADR